MRDIAIRVENLSKVYRLYNHPMDRLKESLSPLRKKYHKDFYALKDVNFEVRKGETVGIIGKNGSGKSTLLKLITGVVTPSAGIVSVSGKISALLELGAGFNPELTGIENIYFNSTLMGYVKDETDSKIDDILSFADIRDFVYQPVKTYSSGMFARLAFAVAINIDPDILIVDEALAVGDVAFQRKCFARMESLKNDGKTIFFVSHSEWAILNLCERAIFLDEGEILLDGEPKMVMANYFRLLSLSGDDFLRFRDELKNNSHISEISEEMPVHREVNEEIVGYNEEYLGSLMPESTIKYESKGVELRNPIITTLDGKKVNLLINGRKYIYSYEAYFTDHCFSVNFSMLIKTLEGAPLGGGQYPPYSSPIKDISAGTTIVVKWEFECLLEEGVYFINCGVMSTQNGTRDYAHRILDANMFKVVSSPQRITTGYINFKLKAQTISL